LPSPRNHFRAPRNHFRATRPPPCGGMENGALKMRESRPLLRDLTRAGTGVPSPEWGVCRPFTPRRLQGKGLRPLYLIVFRQIHHAVL
jgi:hypothetical protein